jgi:hypothetical protein
MVTQSNFDASVQEDWPFDQAPNVAAITTRQVIELNYPILLVTHYEDDDSWAFLCGTTDDHLKDGRVIGMGTALRLDPSLRLLADLPPGWSARRKNRDSKWIRYVQTAA